MNQPNPNVSNFEYVPFPRLQTPLKPLKSLKFTLSFSGLRSPTGPLLRVRIPQPPHELVRPRRLVRDRHHRPRLLGLRHFGLSSRSLRRPRPSRHFGIRTDCPNVRHLDEEVEQK
jgi:hypothetical protein